MHLRHLNGAASAYWPALGTARSVPTIVEIVEIVELAIGRTSYAADGVPPGAGVVSEFGSGM